MSRTILLVVLLCFMSQTFGKTMTECELVWELRKNGFPENQLKDWICLINASGFRRTDVKNTAADGSSNYGIFQINDQYWCNDGDEPGKGCNVRCKDLLLDDITPQLQCTKTIYAAHGFEAWYGWVEKCKGKTLPEIQC
ncbi:hypothetical protein PYW08_015892 [Mythimna loreyi]|uniref:Uncharacterized protein n=1 Tax=Mythimna loreyi TaxID=667449 RepID=A0ACC2QRZ2_9NEOP|nr:hypothetical protein PYW08_015892 [Mythimna loreyi]